MKTYQLLAIGFLGITLTACSKPAPLLQQHPEYIGHWQNEHVTLEIHKDGEVQYKESESSEQKLKDSDFKTSASSMVKAPITRFNGNNFITGTGDFSTTFEVSKPPYQDHGNWKMVVNGQLLSKK